LSEKKYLAYLILIHWVVTINIQLYWKNTMYDK